MAITFVLPTFAAEVSSLKAQNEIKVRNKANAAKYAISFVDSMYNSQNFEAGKVITLYSEKIWLVFLNQKVKVVE